VADVKPSDAFLGVMDFFSTLVPGAVAAFLLLYQNTQVVPLPKGRPITWGSAEGWAVFLVGAYLLGHGITAIGSLLLDKPVYDRLYVRWKQSKELLCAASELKERQLQSLGVRQRPDEISNVFWWAGNVVRLRSPSATTEIEALQAQSKLFRSIVIILLAMAMWWPCLHLGIWLAAIALSLWRYCKLRLDATERTYEYFLALAIPSIGSPPESRIPPSPPST
jgi:hypothetical protein